jgi:hypothetical protein
MTTKLPQIQYKGKKCTIDFRLEEMRCMKKGEKKIDFIKFKDMPEGKNSKIKKKLRGIRARTWHQEYIRGLDD